VGSVRVRATIGAVAVFVAVFAIGAVVFVASLRHTLTDEVRTAARLRAEDVVSVIESGTSPEQLAVDDEEDVAIQVVAANGDVVASSPNLAGRAPIAKLVTGESAEIDAPVDGGRAMIVAERAQIAGGSVTVLVARSLDDVGETTISVTRWFAIGLTVFAFVVGATTWFVVGRALAPVEAMRREVDEISSTELYRRVPRPEGDDEIARLAETMNRMLERLERAQVAQRRFVSDASHELRSPLAVIRQHVEVALAHPERVELIELAETVHAEGLRLERLVDDLLVLARIDERMLPIARREVDLDDLVFSTAHRLRETSPLVIDTSAVAPGRVLGDVAALRRVVTNLADNAVRHARAQVAFSLAGRNGTIVLRVDDDGSGIATSDRERVFERFVRLDDARARDDGGAGLGLAIVAELVRAHGGVVEIRESPLGGARVEVRLAAAPDA
jgi:signal transduction histidine kinase